MEIEDLEKVFNVDLFELVEDQWERLYDEHTETKDLVEDLAPTDQALFMIVGPQCYGKHVTPQKAWEETKPYWSHHFEYSDVRLYYGAWDMGVDGLGAVHYWWPNDEDCDHEYLGLRLKVYEDVYPDDFQLPDKPQTDYENFEEEFKS